MVLAACIYVSVCNSEALTRIRFFLISEIVQMHRLLWNIEGYKKIKNNKSTNITISAFQKPSEISVYVYIFAWQQCSVTPDRNYALCHIAVHSVKSKWTIWEKVVYKFLCLCIARTSAISAYNSWRLLLYISVCSGVPRCGKWIRVYWLINAPQYCELLIPWIKRKRNVHIKDPKTYSMQTELLTSSSICPFRLTCPYCVSCLNLFCPRVCFVVTVLSVQLTDMWFPNPASLSVSECPLVVKQVPVLSQQSATSVCFVWKIWLLYFLKSSTSSFDWLCFL